MATPVDSNRWFPRSASSVCSTQSASWQMLVLTHWFHPYDWALSSLLVLCYCLDTVMKKWYCPWEVLHLCYFKYFLSFFSSKQGSSSSEEEYGVHEVTSSDYARMKKPYLSSHQKEQLKDGYITPHKTNQLQLRRTDKSPFFCCDAQVQCCSWILSGEFYFSKSVLYMDHVCACWNCQFIVQFALY